MKTHPPTPAASTKTDLTSTRKRLRSSTRTSRLGCIHPINLTAEDLPLSSGFALWELTGGRERVHVLSNELGQWQGQEMEEAKAFTKCTGLPLVWREPYQRFFFPSGAFGEPEFHPSIVVMVGVEHGQPVYLSSLNVRAADTIGTDEL